jgi:DNA modification methylase
MNDNKSTELSQPTEPGMHYTACCTLADATNKTNNEELKIKNAGGGGNFDLFGNEVFNKLTLQEKFIENPFSILDSRMGNWRKRVNKWKALGIKSEIGRDAIINGSTNLTKLMKDKSKVKGHVIHEGTSIFDPALCELLYTWFCPSGGLILDPFAGGSVRGIVANYLGFKYTGIDIRQEQIDSNREQCFNILPVNNQPQYYVGDSNIVLDTDFNHKFDLIFSCPPYYNLEKYSDLEGDISNMKYEDFSNAYKSIISKSVNHLKKGGFAIFVVSEVRDYKKNYIGFVPNTIRLFTDTGIKYYNEAIYINGMAGACLTAGRIMDKTKKIKRIHQNILIFKK